ncbi:MAG TPA: G1 family glutamic endopeptidase [Baekduia sp.]|nr:G1 family glutamic endopeptidase [Baekduia sp.]
MLNRRHRAALLSSVAALAVAVGGAPAAQASTASTATSTNWAGYAATRSGVKFRHVSATWVQPAVSCTSGRRTYSSTWVGLGGDSAASTALEQIGTEADCSASGTAHYSTWYELVPDISHSAKLVLKAGDQLHASVAVKGTLVTVKLSNLTRGTSFTKTLRAAAVDTTSAEWVVEAPSLCSGTSTSSCTIGALANFATTSFSAATATTTAGHTGAISDSAWHATAINLTGGPQGRRRFAGETSASASAVQASTGALDGTGSAFTVAFQESTAATTASSASMAGRRAG